MGCRGVHFALTDEDVAAIRAHKNGSDRRYYVTDIIEVREFGGPWACETDLAWDAIHRCFCNGKLNWEVGEYPLNHVIFGGERLHSGDDFIMSLKTPAQAAAIAKAMSTVTRDQLRARYNQIDTREYLMALSEIDFGYTWELFSGLVDFFDRASKAGRYVLFTAGQ